MRSLLGDVTHELRAELNEVVPTPDALSSWTSSTVFAPGSLRVEEIVEARELWELVVVGSGSSAGVSRAHRAAGPSVAAQPRPGGTQPPAGGAEDGWSLSDAGSTGEQPTPTEPRQFFRNRNLCAWKDGFPIASEKERSLALRVPCAAQPLLLLKHHPVGRLPPENRLQLAPARWPAKAVGTVLAIVNSTER
jgi:hypothetical protein